MSAVRAGTHSEFEHRLRRPRRVVAAVAVAEVRGEGDREADVVSGAGNRRGMRAGEGTVRVQSRVHVSRGLDVDDVEQVTAAAEVPDGPPDRVLGLLRAVDGDHEVALVLVVARIRGVERGVGSRPQKKVRDEPPKMFFLAPWSAHVFVR